jgi:hypothetical protein
VVDPPDRPGDFFGENVRHNMLMPKKLCKMAIPLLLKLDPEDRAPWWSILRIDREISLGKNIRHNILMPKKEAKRQHFFC